MKTFAEWFQVGTGHDSPRPWQARLAEEEDPRSRLIRVPTGQGKTQGVLAAWSYHRLERNDDRWPRRLVWCLPMRVLTEQTATEARAFIARIGLEGHVDVHTLMGGVDASDWHLYPERCEVLVGTQDMLLSRAMNRGYASRRARWPMEFGLLSQDALWIHDEVQLMDVGLATSAQLQAFHDEDAPKGLRPVTSWWMSATLQPDWLRSVDTEARHPSWVRAPVGVPAEERTDGPAAISKPVERQTVGAKDGKALAKLVEERHEVGSITLVVCNTVDRAVACCDELRKLVKNASIELVHSRFRPHERAGWRDRFLSRAACSDGADRIIVATQVVEAGVDISARTLVTELAPWPSLVQRFGRCARYEGEGRVLVVDRGHAEDKDARPYASTELAEAWAALESITDVGIDALERFEEGLSPEGRAKLYPYAPLHLLLRGEYDELFDTTPDLTGADLDIGRYIRTGEERDLQVAWDDWEGDHPDPRYQPPRDALCPVPVYQARKWLESRAAALEAHAHDYVTGRWERARAADLRPGMVLAIRATGGGYDAARGFSPSSKAHVTIVSGPEPTLDDLADAAEDQEDLSEVSAYQSIAQHDWEVGQLADQLAKACATELASLLFLAARLHDWGKAHPAFAGSICADAEGRPDRPDLAKAPPRAWRRGRGLYPMPDGPRRAGFRHELASALAAFELLARHDQDHPALLGELGDVFEAGVVELDKATEQAEGALAQELAALSASDFDLVVYLVASHHGKLRASWQSSPHDQDYPLAAGDVRGLPLRGVREGDSLPSIPLPDAAGVEQSVPALDLHIGLAEMGLGGRYGRSWRERSLALQRRFGPGALAYLEALLRAADIRVSRGLEKGGSL